MSVLVMTSSEAEEILGPEVTRLARSISVPPQSPSEVDLLLLLLIGGEDQPQPRPV
jgi:hypothetical protein